MANLISGKTFASAVFYELESDEEFEYSQGKGPKKIMDFTPELIAIIKDSEPIGYQALSNTVVKIEDEVRQIKEYIYDNDKWAKEVKKIINETSEENKVASQNIRKLEDKLQIITQGLEDEIHARKAGDLKVSKNFIRVEAAGYIIVSIIVGGGLTMLIGLLSGFIKF